MTETKPQKDRDRLATEVMGWEISIDSLFWLHNELAVVSVFDWRPDENIEQAFMLLDKFKEWKFYKHPSFCDSDMFYGCTIQTEKKTALVNYEDTKELAIFKAVIKTLGEK